MGQMPATKSAWRRRAWLRQRRLYHTADPADGYSLWHNRELDLLAAGGEFERLGRVAVPVRRADEPYPVFHAARTTDAIVSHAQKMTQQRILFPDQSVAQKDFTGTGRK
jgi:hypothetical protein